MQSSKKTTRQRDENEMTDTLQLHDDRLFPADVATRGIARELYASVADLPIISPHGHTDPSWFADNAPFPDPTELLIIPDHYVFRMLYSQGVSLESLGIGATPRERSPEESRRIWTLFAEHYHLFRGTPSRMWLDYVFEKVFGLQKTLTAATASQYYDHIDDCLKSDEFRPRALFERFNIGVECTR